MASSVPVIRLNDGNSIPALGLGTWKSQPGEVVQAVKDAIDIGYRHFDCAFVYQNEKEVGQGLNEKIAEGVVKREDLYVVSKLWQTFHHVENVEKGCKKSLGDLGLEYLDLYLIHYPEGFEESDQLLPRGENGEILYSGVDYVDTWLAMEELVKKGLVKSIGVSNFNHHQLERVLACATIKPVTNQVECHPYLTQKLLGDWMKERDVTLTAYSPLGSPDRPFAKDGDRNLLADPIVAEIASKYNKTSAQILLRYHIERGFIVVPKSINKRRLQENFDVFNFSISADDMNTLMGLECNERYLKMEIWKEGEHYPFDAEF